MEINGFLGVTSEIAVEIYKANNEGRVIEKFDDTEKAIGLDEN